MNCEAAISHNWDWMIRRIREEFARVSHVELAWYACVGSRVLLKVISHGDPDMTGGSIKNNSLFSYRFVILYFCIDCIDYLIDYYAQ